MTSERVRVLALLDELQAAERTGAAALARWVGSCRTPALRGGLRVMQARDAAHADLAEARLRALGGAPAARPTQNLQSLCGVLSAADVSDRSKVAILLSRFPHGVYDPFAELAQGLDDDAETRALLETIGDDERASVQFLRAVVAGEWADEPPVAGPRATTAALLDAFAAAESAGADVFAAWIAACAEPGLRGGLRTAAARERTHATLLAERLRELGTPPRTTLPDGVRRDALGRFGAADVSDHEKLAAVVGRYPAGTDAGAHVASAAEEQALDPETRTMLSLIAAGETATIAWLRAYHSALAGGAAHVAPSRQIR